VVHVVKLVRRRFPKVGERIVTSLLALSASALAIGVGIMLLN
jgi:hypothetical protein